MAGKKRNQKKDPKILITEYADTEDYRRQYSLAARKLKAKPKPTEEEKTAKIALRAQKMRDYFKTLRANPETRRLLNRQQGDYKKSRPDIMARRNTRRRVLKNKQRMTALARYGTNGEPICCICGFDDVRALVIDHIDNNGAAHRKEVGKKMYPWLIKNGFPEGFQTLCSNCNTIKEYDRIAALTTKKAEDCLAGL